MMQQIVTAVWVSIVLTVSLGLALNSGLLAARKGPDPQEVRTETAKLPMISVPVLLKGEVAGYVLAKFTATISVATGEDGGAKKYEAFLTDTIFREIYASQAIELQRKAKPDLDELTRSIVTKVNERAGRAAVRELFVVEWNYVGRNEARQ